MTVPSLLELCIEAASQTRHWTVQRRNLERLPDHAANDLLARLIARQSGHHTGGTTTARSGSSSDSTALLRKKSSTNLARSNLARSSSSGANHASVHASGGSAGGGGGGGVGALRPATLELFRHAVTRVELRGPSWGPEWLAVLAGFSHLHELRLASCSRITSAAIAQLAGGGGGGAATATTAAAAAPPPPQQQQQTTVASPASAASSWRRSGRLPPSTPALAASASSRQPSQSPTAVISTSPLFHGSRSPPAAAPPAPTVPLIPTTPAPAAAAPALSPAAASLCHLDLGGCGRVGDAALGAVGRMGQLMSLSITETGVGGEGLAALTGLSRLTRLEAGGIQSAGNAAWCGLLPHLPRLRHLDIWGSNAGAADAFSSSSSAASNNSTKHGIVSSSSSSGGSGSGTEQFLLLLATCLPQLEQLGLAWTQLRALPALPQLKVLDMRHCQLREVWWPTGRPGGPLALRQLLLAGVELGGGAVVAGETSEWGLAGVIRHAAPSLELLNLADMSCAEQPAWGPPLAALGTAAGAREVERAVASTGAPSLTHLDISRTAVRPEDLSYLQSAPSLRRLVASGTRCGCPAGAAELAAAGLAELQDLDLSRSGVIDESVSWLQQLTALTNLNLAHNDQLTMAPPRRPAPRLEQPQEQQQQQQQQQAPQHLVAFDPWAPDVPDRPGAAGEAGNRSRASSGSSGSSSDDEASAGSGSSSSWPGGLRRLNLL
ncbi:hypothetical protein Agub_g4011, partial [Astrephomene gubernaculifera]